MMTMTTARAGLKNVELTKVLQFLEIVADAERLRGLTLELVNARDMAIAEQEKAKQFAGSADRLHSAQAYEEQAEQHRAHALSELRKASEDAAQTIGDAKREAAEMLRLANEEVTALRGDIDRDVAAAVESLEAARAKEQAAGELHEQAAKANEQVEERRAELEGRMTKMQELMG